MPGPSGTDLATSNPSAPPVDGRSVWEQRRDRVSFELEQIGVSLFAAKGYQAVSYEDIAQVAGVSSRTVYRYFPAKEEFLLANPRRSNALIRAALVEHPRTSYPVSDIIDLLISLSEVHHDALDTVVNWARALQSDPDVASRVHGEQAMLLERIILEFCLDERGSAVETTSARAVAATIAAVSVAVFQDWVVGGGREELPVLYRAALHAVRTSIRPES